MREEGGKKLQRRRKSVTGKRKACLVFLPVCVLALNLLMNIQHFVCLFGFVSEVGCCVPYSIPYLIAELIKTLLDPSFHCSSVLVIECHPSF